ncbi:FAD-dependent oxidoreductase [Kibdelosporangium lantanae]
MWTSWWSAGVTGAGVALDAAARGLSVALVEANDLAHGTSRWSSKLVHGGLRYLAHGDIALAYESAVERGIIMTTTAPHLTRTLPQLIPLHDTISRRQEAIILTGLHLGGLLRRAARTPKALLPGPRRIPTAEALALAPGLRKDGLRGGLLAFDGQLIDDARFVIALARTAAGMGARIITRARALNIDRTSAEVEDTLTGTRFEIHANRVINATGVWAGQLVPSVKLRPSRGSHIVVSGEGFTGTSLTVPVPGSGNRFVLVLPQLDGRVYVGLTDEPVDDIPDVPTAPESDVEFLLRTASSVLERDLTRDDVLGSYAGLRPLLEAEGASADLSREHAVLTAPNGVLTIVGGKLTTYRRMAADAVDATGLTTRPSPTRNLPLVGAGPVPAGAPGRLVARYGSEAGLVAQGDLTEVHPGVTAAEVAWAVAHEGALCVEDVVDRRTRVGLVPAEGVRLSTVLASLWPGFRSARSSPSRS